MQRHACMAHAGPPEGTGLCSCLERVWVTLCVFDPCGHGFDSGPVGTTDFCYPCSVFKDVAFVLAHSDRFPRGQGSSVHALDPLRRTPSPHLVCSSRPRQRSVPLTSNRPRHHAHCQCGTGFGPVPGPTHPRPMRTTEGFSITRLDAFAPAGPATCLSPSPTRFPAVSTNPRHNRVPRDSLATTRPVSPELDPRRQSMDSVHRPVKRSFKPGTSPAPSTHRLDTLVTRQLPEHWVKPSVYCLTKPAVPAGAFRHHSVRSRSPSLPHRGGTAFFTYQPQETGWLDPSCARTAAA